VSPASFSLVPEKLYRVRGRGAALFYKNRCPDDINVPAESFNEAWFSKNDILLYIGFLPRSDSDGFVHSFLVPTGEIVYRYGFAVNDNRHTILLLAKVEKKK